MVDATIIERIQQLRLKTVRSLTGVLVGDHRTTLIGTGLEFDQLREYRPGDDVRFVDWNSTTRTGTMRVRQYHHSCDRTTIIMVDISASIGAAGKRDLVQQVAGIFAFVAAQTQDAIGLVLFSADVEWFVPPTRSRAQMQLMLYELFSRIPQFKGTNIEGACSYVLKRIRRNAVVILVTDAIGAFGAGFAQLARMHEVIVVRCQSPAEQHMISVGRLRMRDPETGNLFELNTDDSLERVLTDRITEQDQVFRRYNIPVLTVGANEDSVNAVVGFIRKRMGR